MVWPLPLSLATTRGISFWFLFLALLRCFSSGGSPHTTMDSSYDTWALPHVDCSIRKSADIVPTYGSPQLIAVSHVLLRLSVPRHSPCALCSLTILRYLLVLLLELILMLITLLRCQASLLFAVLVITPTPLTCYNHLRDFHSLVVVSRYSKATSFGSSLFAV